MDEEAALAESAISKSGWRTTEFYVTVITALSPVFTAVFHQDFGGQDVQAWATVAAAFATATYAWSRSHSKRAAADAWARVEASRVTPVPRQDLQPVNVSVSADAGSAIAPQSDVPRVPNAAFAAVPIDTLAMILARLDLLTEAQRERNAR